MLEKTILARLPSERHASSTFRVPSRFTPEGAAEVGLSAAAQDRGQMKDDVCAGAEDRGHLLLIADVSLGLVELHDLVDRLGAERAPLVEPPRERAPEESLTAGDHHSHALTLASHG